MPDTAMEKLLGVARQIRPPQAPPAETSPLPAAPEPDDEPMVLVAGNTTIDEQSDGIASLDALPIAATWPDAPLPEEFDMTETDPPAADVARSLLSATPGLRADVEFSGGEIMLTVWLSTDPGPMRGFRPFLTIALDEPHATELLGTTAIALRDARQAREAA